MLTEPHNYMERALCLAELALGYTSPNPAVGCVVVQNENVVGLGFTQPPGDAHAEIMALAQAGDRSCGATMYVTLEPCCHFGKTPPCTMAICNAGISEIHIATLDPNPFVNGKGVAELKKKGIRLFIGEYEEKAKIINESYIKYITTKLPFVTAKYAMSLDGKIATRTGDSKWITGEESRKYVHRLRQVNDAVMVGANTVIKDNPYLTVREGVAKGGIAKKQPTRIIVDGKGKAFLLSHVFNQPGKVILAVARPLIRSKATALKKLGVELILLDSEDAIVDLSKLLAQLGEFGITSILVEGGGNLMGHLFDMNLIDKVVAFISPIVIGGLKATTPVAGNGIAEVAKALKLRDIMIDRLGNDLVIVGYPDRIQYV